MNIDKINNEYEVLLNELKEKLDNKSISENQKKLKNLRYICSDIKDIKSNNFLLKV